MIYCPSSTRKSTSRNAKSRTDQKHNTKQKFFRHKRSRFVIWSKPLSNGRTVNEKKKKIENETT